MKKILFACLTSAFIWSANAQQLDQTQLDTLAALKKAGKLQGNISYVGADEVTNLTITYPDKNSRKKGGNNQVQSSTECDCWIPRDNTFSLVPFIGGTASNHYANDDGSTGSISLPFGFNFYGTTYHSLYINNNGNVTFTNSYSTFSAATFPSNSFKMIAPF